MKRVIRSGRVVERATTCHVAEQQQGPLLIEDSDGRITLSTQAHWQIKAETRMIAEFLPPFFCSLCAKQVDDLWIASFFDDAHTIMPMNFFLKLRQQTDSLPRVPVFYCSDCLREGLHS